MSDHLFLYVIRSLGHVKSGLCVGNWNIVCINADNISLTRGVLLFVPTMIMQWRVLFALVIEGNYSTKQ
ncbi:hypothetical protein EYC80_008136 [Monilinia laxa]|uniref:Uncharacterized protein n=1 Tax=Monilinia laxa TaxID=61186 RepID=A0A5N6JVM1_MONLA|nr:hypothetical protein EYC80_008136 [Monilinia laxa]